MSNSKLQEKSKKHYEKFPFDFLSKEDERNIENLQPIPFKEFVERYVKSGDSVIDVGCGWGIAGIWCARELGAEVTSVDADANVFPYLDAVAELNGASTTHCIKRFEQLSTAQLAQFDVLIAADICFWDDLVDPVFNMVNRAVKAGVKRILIADPERPTFHEMAQRCVDAHCADVLEWQTRGSVEARGAIMVIENA